MNNKNTIKKLLEENFAYLTSMSVKEYTLYRKWLDLKKKYTPKGQESKESFDDFFDESDVSSNPYPEFDRVKKNIWIPESPEDYLKLEPELVLVANSNSEVSTTWSILRDFCHGAIWHQSPGRLLRYYVIDSVTKKYLGILSMGSDFISVGGRDEVIKWTKEDRLGGRLKNTLMGSTIAAVQPFGYNYNGGKLMALLAASSTVAEQWEEQYKDKLVGVTTTSLYGGKSMYNRLKYWKKCKSTTGEIQIEPSEDVYDVARDWLSENYPEMVPKTPPGKKILSHPKYRYLVNIYKVCGIKPPINNAPRGVYWNELYVDTCPFLRNEISCVTEKRYDNRPEALTSLWKEMYAKKRINSLQKENRISTDILFYDDIISMEWEEVKEKYLS